MSRLLKSSLYFPLQFSIDAPEPTAIEELFRIKGNRIIHRQTLLAGNYLFDGDLLVERKTIPDFCKSIKDGRMFHQCENQATIPYLPVPCWKEKTTDILGGMLQRFTQATKEGLFLSPTFKQKGQPLLEQRNHLPADFPGIGVNRAERLLINFVDLRTECKAGAE
ncbi:ERCC4 domain-containing protein [Cyclobacterium xiamenense]|uniref:ERCC4 domain-containing protein n=2 Tax=Cyclobacterium xiamenense TaxID=1297121 RepID=A0A1H7BM92_9BACT|nr:ERCC4 domain-containing protein [Cyclobacterium xiamenense]